MLSSALTPRAPARSPRHRRWSSAAASSTRFSSKIAVDEHRRRSRSIGLVARGSPGDNQEGSPPPFDDSEEAMMLADLERYSKRTNDAARGSNGSRSNASSSPSSSARGAADPTASPSESDSGGFKAALDKFLVADFFFVLFALAWLVAGVATNGGREAVEGGSSIDSPLLTSWLALWPAVFQPAIGILMAGALVSGGVGWLREKRSE